MLKFDETIEEGKNYLLSCINDGLCLEFFQLNHGPSLAWTTACIGSTLAEFDAVPSQMTEAILNLQRDNGGWAYNEAVSADADSTLRVLQFFEKIKFQDNKVLIDAEAFVLRHQHQDGGITTFLPEAISDMGWENRGWSTSHPCVTAVASRVLKNDLAKEKTVRFLKRRFSNQDYRAYWWNTPWYVSYESFTFDSVVNFSIGSDPVEISLCLLKKAALGILDIQLLADLMKFRLEDGSFHSSRLFMIPRQQHLKNATGKKELVEDRRRVFATAAAIVAINRQKALLK